jgi:hypothetical protein
MGDDAVTNKQYAELLSRLIVRQENSSLKN